MNLNDLEFPFEELVGTGLFDMYHALNCSFYPCGKCSFVCLIFLPVIIDLFNVLNCNVSL